MATPRKQLLSQNERVAAPRISKNKASLARMVCRAQDDVRQITKGQIMQEDHGQEFGFNSKCNVTSLEDFQNESKHKRTSLCIFAYIIFYTFKNAYKIKDSSQNNSHWLKLEIQRQYIAVFELFQLFHPAITLPFPHTYSPTERLSLKVPKLRKENWNSK